MIRWIALLYAMLVTTALAGIVEPLYHVYTPDGERVESINGSTSPLKAHDKLLNAPLACGDYIIDHEPFRARKDVGCVDPAPPVDPDPVEPDPEPEPTPAPTPDPVEPPAGPQPLPMTYKPQIKAGPYSLDACKFEVKPEWPVYTLRQDESLWAFRDRAFAKSKGTEGLVLEFPAEAVNGRVCPRAFIGDAKIPEHLIMRGIADEDGNPPRFYCRNERYDGNIPNEDVEAWPLSFAGSKTTVYDGLHIDGYKALTVGGYDLIVKNSYFHHQPTGMYFSNQGGPKRVDICGSEMSHSGQGNVKHVMYVHRSLDHPAETVLTVVDSLLHSAKGSEIIKSIADANIIVNNKIYSTLETDPSFSRMDTSINVSIPACSRNLIEGNKIHFVRGTNPVGKYNIGIRNRTKVMKGCDIPPYGSDQFNDPAYWADWQNITPPELFTTVIRNNEISCETEGGQDFCGYAVTSWGTWPTAVPYSFATQYLQDVPENDDGTLAWVERSRVIMDGNTFPGYAPEDITYSGRHGVMPNPPPNFAPDDYYGPTIDGDRFRDYSYFEGPNGERVE